MFLKLKHFFEKGDEMNVYDTGAGSTRFGVGKTSEAEVVLTLEAKRAIARLKAAGRTVPIVARNGRIIAMDNAFTLSNMLAPKTAHNAISKERSSQAIFGEVPLVELTSLRGEATSKKHFVPESHYMKAKKDNGKLDEEEINQDSIEIEMERALGIAEPDAAVDEVKEEITEAEKQLGLEKQIKRKAQRKSTKHNDPNDDLGEL